MKIGLMPDGGGTFWLPRLVGTARAMQMILLAEKLEAAELKALGVVMDRSSTPTALREATLAVARDDRGGPPLATRPSSARSTRAGATSRTRSARARGEQLKLLRSQDVMEGIMAWVSRRDPVFQGK